MRLKSAQAPRVEKLGECQEIMPLDRVPHPQIFLYIAAAIELLGGLGILWAATRRIGAIFLGVIYLIFALLSGSFPFVHTEWCQMRNQVYQPASQHSQPCT